MWSYGKVYRRCGRRRNSSVESRKRRSPPHFTAREAVHDSEGRKTVESRKRRLPLHSTASEAVHKSEKWKIAERAPHKPLQLYSTSCPYKLRCKHGLSCRHKHTASEREYFLQNGGKGNPSLKVKMCNKHPNCPRKMEDCKFAHGEEDAWCLNCRQSVGHFTDDCPIKK